MLVHRRSINVFERGRHRCFGKYQAGIACVWTIVLRKGKFMSSHTRQILGWGLVLAVVLSVAATILGLVIPGPAGPDGPSPDSVSWLDLGAGILFLISLPMAYRAQKPQIGLLGLIGVIGLWLAAALFDIVLPIVSLIAVSSHHASALASNPYLPTLFLGGVLLQIICSGVFGLGVIRARIFSTLIGWLLLASALAAILDFPLSGTSELIVQTLCDMLLFLGMGLGFAIASRASRTVLQPAGMAK